MSRDANNSSAVEDGSLAALPASDKLSRIFPSYRAECDVSAVESAVSSTADHRIATASASAANVVAAAREQQEYAASFDSVGGFFYVASGTVDASFDLNAHEHLAAVTVVEAYHLTTLDDCTLRICNRPALGIAFQLWPAAHVLCRWLEQNASVLRGRRVLELGAGCALGALMCSALGGATRVCATDLPEAVTHMQMCVEQNAHVTLLPPVEVAALKWGAADTWTCNFAVEFDLFIGSDLLYWEHLAEPLVDTLSRLLSAPHSVCYLAQKHRWLNTEKRFFALCRKRGLESSVVAEIKFADNDRRFISIIRIQPKR